MNVGPGGFGHAPVTKGIVLTTCGASLLWHFSQGSHRSVSARALPLPLAAVARALALQGPGELLFGLLLLYNTRVYERQAGSSKYGAYVAFVTGTSCLLQLTLARLLRQPLAPLPAWPLPLVFASFVPLLLDIPPGSKFTLLGVPLTDKVFAYAMGAQLLLSGGRRTLVAGAAGLLAGALYRLNAFGVQRLRVPKRVARLFTRMFRVVLGDGLPAAAVMLPARPGAAPSGQHRAGGAQRPAPPAAAVPSAPPVVPSPALLEQLLAMGFDRDRAAQALQRAGNNLEVAIASLV